MFLLGNSTPTIPHQLRQHLHGKFPHGLADAADALGKKGSNAYEVNQWLWQFGRGKFRLGGLSVAATEERHIAVVKVQQRRQWQPGPKEPQGSQDGRGKWRNGMKISLIQYL